MDELITKNSNIEGWIYYSQLLTDGYSGYESLGKKYRKITHAWCWTHSRRCFVKSEPEATEDPLALFSQLYKVEDDICKQGLEGSIKREYVEPTTIPSARLSTHQWRQIIKQQHESGLSQKSFINPATLAFQHLTNTSWRKS